MIDSQFLNDGRNWERKPTNIPGVSLFRLPSTRGRPAFLAIEINPVGTSGSITKKRGVTSELEEIRGLLGHEKVSELAKRIDEVNPKGDTTTTDIFEV